MVDTQRHFGCIRDRPDARDHKYTPSAQHLASPPAAVDLRPLCPPVYDQSPLNSCTANATAAAVEFERMRLKLTPDYTPSRLFIYYNGRKMAGTEDKDDGAPLRDVIKVVAKQGDCPEPQWPYVPAKVTDAPPTHCYTAAVKYGDLTYQAVQQDLAHLKACLAGGHPFVLAIHVYSGSETPQAKAADTFPVPKAGETLLGTHAIMAVGYQDSASHFIVRNSWGANWGQAGYFYLPYAYVTDPRYAGDFWTLRLAPLG
jgi:C1A family cysteine protease